MIKAYEKMVVTVWSPWSPFGHRGFFTDVKNPASNCGLFYLAPPAGLEPATYGLTVRRSTD